MNVMFVEMFQDPIYLINHMIFYAIPCDFYPICSMGFG